VVPLGHSLKITCVSGTVPVIGCTIIFDDGNYDLTGDITPTSGSSSIRFNTANRNTFNYTGNINTGATEAGGVFVASSTFNNVTINGNIDVGALGLYGILTGPGAGNNTIIMNGNITTNRYLSYGYYSLFENDTNFTLNGNITTDGDDAPGISIFASNNANITLNGNINVQGETRLLNGRGIDIINSSGITLTNLGTITTAGDNPYDIYVRGTTTVATLNNRQAGLTYYGKIPTNYNAVINSTSDYGKIIFSTVSGTTSFGIYDGSVLQNNTTYLSVMDGLEASNITAGYSGDYSYDGKTWAWTLENSSANLWDLAVGDCIGCITEDTTDTTEDTTDTTEDTTTDTTTEDTTTEDTTTDTTTDRYYNRRYYYNRRHYNRRLLQKILLQIEDTLLPQKIQQKILQQKILQQKILRQKIL
jgi:mucin-19